MLLCCWHAGVWCLPADGCLLGPAWGLCCLFAGAHFDASKTLLLRFASPPLMFVVVVVVVVVAAAAAAAAVVVVVVVVAAAVAVAAVAAVSRQAPSAACHHQIGSALRDRHRCRGANFPLDEPLCQDG